MIATNEYTMTANENLTIIKDLSAGQKNVHIVFIVLDIGEETDIRAVLSVERAAKKKK